MAYDDPAFQMRREVNVPNVTGIASTSVRKLHMFQATKLKAVHATIVTAGTHTDAGFDILVGTASVGAVVCGTATAGSVKTSGLIDATVPQNGVIDIKGKADSATLVASFSVEHEVSPDATET